MRKMILVFSVITIIYSCKTKVKKPDPVIDVKVEITHPEWITHGNIYEVNLRQYTREGTFKAFAQHLERLKDMGVQTLWFMPITPISKLERKGTLGSYYAVADYMGVNPEYGTLAEWEQLVDSIHSKGMKVIIDWVPNHTGADNPWLTRHPNFFIKDSLGKPAVAFDWADVRQLDFTNQEMQDSMIAIMKYWVNETGIDGYRVDVAWNVPATFWNKCIPELKKVNKDLFFLAEGDKPYLMTSGFDAFYPWEMFHKMVDVAAGKSPAFALDSVKQKYDTTFPSSAIPLYFTSNHDENSWNKSDYGTFPGPVHGVFAVFTQTMAGSVPLIYSGQEEPLLRKLEFFEKDPIRFGKFERADFYRTLLSLRRSEEALSIDGTFRKISAGNDSSVYAYVRAKGNSKVLVILNFSKKEQKIILTDKTVYGSATNFFLGKPESLDEKPLDIEPWGYRIYTFNN